MHAWSVAILAQGVPFRFMSATSLPIGRVIVTGTRVRRPVVSLVPFVGKRAGGCPPGCDGPRVERGCHYASREKYWSLLEVA